MHCSGYHERYATFDELCGPAGDGTEWLSPPERLEFDRLHNERRRQSWLCGRIVSKRLLLDQLDDQGLSPADVVIVSRDQAGRSVRPQIVIGDEPLAWNLSVSHSDRAAFAAISTSPGERVGVDLVSPRPVDASFVRFWFSPREQDQLHSADSRQIVERWSVKEALYKALNDGESFTPRQVEVLRAENGAPDYRCFYDGRDLGGALHLSVREMGEEILVLARVRSSS